MKKISQIVFLYVIIVLKGSDLTMSNRLQKLRKEKGLSQKDLTDLLNNELNFTVSMRTLQNWETDKTPIKSAPAQQLADYFGVQVSYLLGYSDFRTWAEEDFFYTTGYPMNSSITPDKKVVKIDLHHNALSDDEFMALPPEERKKYIGEYLDAMSKALSSLTDTVANTAEIAADVTGEQISKLSDSLIQALAKLSNIKNKD